MPSTDEGLHVVVGLGSRMAGLEHKGTRWREVLRAWAGHPRVATLTVLDYPRFGSQPQARRGSSWLPPVALVDVRVMGRQRVGPETRLGWALTAAVVRRALGPHSGRRVVVAAAPVWVPLLPRVPAARRVFDGVDDWRAYAGASAQLSRIEQGYRQLGDLDAVTAVSPVLAERLRQLGARDVRVVGNGIHRQQLAEAVPWDDPRLPDGAFAVYVGNVEDRVDLDLLEQVSASVPVVVAGPADGATAERLTLGPLLWLGTVDADVVPRLLARAAVGLIPHRRTPLTESMDPMKLLEYLGAGLPVVATPLPGLAAREGVVTGEGSDFVAAVRAAVGSGRGPAPAGLVDWDEVAGTLLTAYAGELW